MTENPHIWQQWANILHRWGLETFTAWLLEAIQPVTVVGAQFVYLGQPFLKIFFPGEHSEAMAQMLEEPEVTSAFVRFLREATV